VSNFCSQCGIARTDEQLFCSNCGRKFQDESVSTISKESPLQPEIVVSKSVYPWISLGVAAIIGIPALQSAIGMPTQAEYVTFDFTFDHVINGGWYIWYSGDSAIMAKFTKSGGMEASTLRLILWFISGFSVSLAFPGLKKLLQSFKTDDSK
jgi:hypothetical protein